MIALFYSVQSTLSCEGGDGWIRSAVRCLLYFAPYFHAGGATIQKLPPCPYRCYFFQSMPHAGSNLFAPSEDATSALFQSTLPRRERLAFAIDHVSSSSFQSTLPRRERPQKSPILSKNKDFYSGNTNNYQHYPLYLNTKSPIFSHFSGANLPVKECSLTIRTDQTIPSAYPPLHKSIYCQNAPLCFDSYFPDYKNAGCLPPHLSTT